MAIGDVVSGMASVAAAGGNLDYQPAAGVEAVIKSLVVGKVPDTALNVQALLIDGTIGKLFWNGNHTSAVPEPTNISVFLTNAIYLRLTNSTGGALVLAYSGIQIK